MYTYALAAIAASIPILIWVALFYKVRPERKDFLFLAFIAGCFSPVIMLLYQKFWGTSMNVIFFEIKPVNFKIALSAYSSGYFLQNFLVFVFGVGMAEEFVKHFVIRKEKPAGVVLFFVMLLLFATIYLFYHVFAGSFSWVYFYYVASLWVTFYIFMLVHKRLEFKSIDQVILAGIMSALGFAFIENIIYVVRVLEMSRGSGIGQAATVLIGRSIFVVMVHMLCSGIFAYHYGVSLFAGPYLKEHEVQGKKFFLVHFLRKILRFAKKTIYEEEKLLEGLVLAMLAHGIYDFILAVNLTLGQALGFIGIKSSINIPLFAPVMVLYLFGGYWYLMRLLQEKDNHVKFGLVGSAAMPEQDYNELVEKIHRLTEEQKKEDRLVETDWASKKEIAKMKKYMAYMQKFKVLEKKYVGTRWIKDEARLQELKAKVAAIKLDEGVKDENLEEEIDEMEKERHEQTLTESKGEGKGKSEDKEDEK